MFADGMWIIYLEMLVAFTLLIVIVWWTLPKRKTPPKEDKQGEDPPR